MTDKDSIILHASQLRPIREMSDDQQLEMFKAIMAYVFDEPYEFHDPVCKFSFKFVAEQFGIDRARWEKKCEQNRLNGMKAYQKKSVDSDTYKRSLPIATDRYQTVPVATERYRPLPNGTLYDNDNESDIRERKQEKKESAQRASDSPCGESMSQTALVPLETGKKSFIPPTLEEVVDYAATRGGNVDPKRFFDYYEQRGWVTKKKPVANWKATFNTWIRRQQKNADDATDAFPEDFQLIWNTYPNHWGSEAALKEFERQTVAGMLPDPKELARRIRYRLMEPDWSRKPEFIPSLERWLRNGGYNDAGCFDRSSRTNSDRDELENAICAKYNFGMRRKGQTLEENLAEQEAMEEELRRNGL